LPAHSAEVLRSAIAAAATAWPCAPLRWLNVRRCAGRQRMPSLVS